MVIILRCENASKNSSSGNEEKHREQRRKTLTAACGLSDKKQGNYVVRYGSNHMVKPCGRSREQHIIPSPQVLYCNSSSSGCQGSLKIKITTQNLIRSKQRKSLSRSFPSCRRKAVCTHMMEMVAFCFQEHQNAGQNSKIDTQ